MNFRETPSGLLLAAAQAFGVDETTDQIIWLVDGRRFPPAPVEPPWVPLGDHSRLAGLSWENRKDKRRAILSAGLEPDGIHWLHLSVSRRDRIPSYEDLKAVKALFMGDVLAVQVFPRAADHVNLHPFVLHLWAPLHGNPIPDFRRMGSI